MSSKSYKDLAVWQKSKQLVLIIYQLTNDFPPNEQYGLTSQMRRAAVSIPSNIAEGCHRQHPKDKQQFYVIAYGSAGELDSQLSIAHELFPHHDMQEAQAVIVEVLKMLNALTHSNNKNF